LSWADLALSLVMASRKPERYASRLRVPVSTWGQRRGGRGGEELGGWKCQCAPGVWVRARAVGGTGG
jgi:hypothetical protein